ncbi:MAG: type II toxin-antitoxin system HipA family toxin [Desulfovibrionaceae bacterium]
MARGEQAVLVHVSLGGVDHRVGTLWVHAAGSGERASFQYEPQWLESAMAFSLEPALQLGEGVFPSPDGKALFGAFGDSAPDRWGRALLDRREGQIARAEQRTRRRLLDSDYLLMVNDRARQGALRFKADEDGPFLAPEGGHGIPPLLEIGRLMRAAGRILDRQEADQDVQDLVEPGASLGGARPKASVLDANGGLLIAKFPSPRDEWDVELWECVCLTLARKAGIPVPGFRLERIAGRNVLLLERFDRGPGGIRIPYLSAMSMVQRTDGERGSYLEIAEALHRHGASATADLQDLWRRMVFNILVSNVDDHLRNHGFLYRGSGGWTLSPVFDLEPMPAHKKARELQTYITLDDGTATLDLAYEVAGEFGLRMPAARDMACRVASAVRDWERTATGLGASSRETETMRSAFDHQELRRAVSGR